MKRDICKGIQVLNEDGPRKLFSLLPNYIDRKTEWPFRRILIVNRHLINQIRYNAVAHPYKIVFVSPDIITRYTREFDKWESVARIQGGEWDQNARPITEMKKYVAVRERIEKEKEWSETGIYEHLLNRLDNEEISDVDGCTSAKELKNRYKSIDNLISSLQENGYDLRRHINPPEWWQCYNIDYVAAHIGRNGEFIFGMSGCHRLTICKILDIGPIPVWIRARHSKWQKIRESIDYADGEHGDYIYHPDIQDLLLKEH